MKAQKNKIFPIVNLHRIIDITEPTMNVTLVNVGWTSDLARDFRLQHEADRRNHPESSADRDPQANCSTCGDLNPKLWVNTKSRTASIAELKTTASLCPACKAIFEAINDNAEDWKTTDGHAMVFHAHENRLVVSVSVSYNLTGGNIELYRHGEKRPKHEPDLWPAVGVGRRLSPALLVLDAVKTIKSWLKSCKSKHPLCSRKVNATLPTRVILSRTSGRLEKWLPRKMSPFYQLLETGSRMTGILTARA